MTTVDSESEVSVDDMDSLRYSMRTDGKGGFIFVNHYQRLAKLNDVKDVVIDTGKMKFPAFDVKGDVAFVFPFGIKLGTEELEYATAQPICKCGNTYFFAEIPGIPVSYKFVGKDILKTFSDGTFGLEDKDMSSAKRRTIVRGIVVDQADNVAVFNKGNANEYKLPGGMVSDGESIEGTFLSEIKREIGCEIEIIEDIGIVEEHMGQDDIIQETYVYVGRVLEKGKIDYNNQEVDEFGKVMWVSPEEALKLISDYKKEVDMQDIENVYHAKFSVYRDEFITRYYLIKYIY
jgi:ADP-ribose pyrophosphatase YjhB (NUDIX family)